MDEDFDPSTIEEDNNGWFRSLRGHSYGTDYEMNRDALNDPTARKFLSDQENLLFHLQNLS